MCWRRAGGSSAHEKRKSADRRGGNCRRRSCGGCWSGPDRKPLHRLTERAVQRSRDDGVAWRHNGWRERCPQRCLGWSRARRAHAVPRHSRRQLGEPKRLDTHLLHPSGHPCRPRSTRQPPGDVLADRRDRWSHCQRACRGHDHRELRRRRPRPPPRLRAHHRGPALSAHGDDGGGVAANGAFIMPVPAPQGSLWYAATIGFTAPSPGTYYIICPVPGHAQQGMWAKFIVC